MSQQITTDKSQGPALDKTDEVPLGDKQLVDQEAIPTVDYRNPASEGEDDISNDIPWKYKWIGLAVVMALPLGRNWADAGLGPLRNTLRNELGINNEQFGVLSSAEAVINCIWPFFGGIVLDWVGVETVSPACTSIILFGSLITAGGIRARNWQVVAGGFILRGFGTALLDSCQQVFFHALGGRRGLAFAFGLENAIAEAISLASEAAAVPIYQAHGLDVVFWIPVAFCAVSVIINFVYIWYAKKVIPAQYRPSSGRDRARSDNASVKVISFASVWLLPWCFWMLPMTQLLQSGAASGFSVARADIIRLRGYKETTAGFLTSGATVIQVLLSPIVGYSIDRWGHRFHYVALAPILWVTAAGLLGFSSVHPLVALVFASLAGSINGAPLQMAMHLLVADHRLIGTAFGVWRAFNNSGSVIMEVSFGRMLDASPFRDTVKQYSNVLFLKIGLKSWAFCLGLLYILVDLRYLGGGLTMTRAKRDKIESTISAEEKEFHPITRRSPVKWVTIMSMCTMAAMCITGWTLFFMGLAS